MTFKKNTPILFISILLVLLNNIVNAQTNYALDFDGVNDYIYTGYLPLANNSFTIEFWARQDVASLDRYRMIVSQGTGVENQGLHIGFRDNNTFTFAFYGNDLDVTTATTDTEWHHWACTYDANTNYRTIYKDGVNVASDIATSDYSGGDKLYIGFTSFTNDNFWDGQIDEVRIWSNERSQAEILSTMNLYIGGTETTLLANWRFDDGSGYTADDLKNSYDGYLQEMTQDDWVISTSPFGSGVNSTQNGLSTGSWIAFENTGIRIKFSALGTWEYVSVTKLNNAPNVSPTDLDDLFDSQYWVINNSSGSSAIGDVEFSVAEDLTSLDNLNPTWIRLYEREKYSDNSWDFKKTPDYIDDSNDYATFNTLLLGKQFICGRKTTPIVTSLFPVDNETNGVTNGNLIINFYENISAGSGNVIIKKISDDSVVEIIAASACTFSGVEVTINPLSNLAFNTEYYVIIENSAFKDATNTYFEGFSSNDDWNFRTFDEFQPSSLNPADNETAFVNDANLIINFNRNAVAGSGNIYIKKYSDDSLVETISASSCSISDAEATINPVSDLAYSTDFYVLIENTSFKDIYGNYFSGYSSKDDWNFTTLPEVYITNLSPSVFSHNLPNINLVITFNNNISAGSGNIYIKKYSDDSLVETISASSCSISGAEVTINPASDFGRHALYYVLIENTAFRDGSNNYFLGYSSKDDWEFYILDELRIISLYPQHERENIFVFEGNRIEITFNRNVSVDPIYFGLTIISLNPFSAFASLHSSACTIHGSTTAYIYLPRALDYSTQYAVSLNDDSFFDEYGESSDGIDYGEWVFTTMDDPNATPVELTNFNAELINSQVELNWQTATEVNNYGFEVQRTDISSQISENEWTTLSFVEGHGNSNSPKDYTFTDNLNLALNPNHNLQYRLKQIDTDGSFEYSDIVEVEIELPTEYKLSQNYPNPFNPSTTISYSIPSISVIASPVSQGRSNLSQIATSSDEAWTPRNDNVTLKIYNILGQEVATLVNQKQTPGNYEVKFDASNLTSGIYIYRLVSDKFTTSKKLLLMK